MDPDFRKRSPEQKGREGREDMAERSKRAVRHLQWRMETWLPTRFGVSGQGQRLTS